jgi:hypothetical protein
MALQKKKMVKDGKLGKHGEKLDGVTPAEWSRDYVDYNRDEASLWLYRTLLILTCCVATHCWFFRRRRATRYGVRPCPRYGQPRKERGQGEKAQA